MTSIRSAALALSLAFATQVMAQQAKLTPVVSVDLGPALLSFASSCASAQDPQAAEIIKNLRSVRVRVYECPEASLAEVQQTVHGQTTIKLDSDWSKIVSVNKPNEALVDVHVRMKNANEVSGVVVTVASEDHKGVLVEVDGEIRADQVQNVIQRLNLQGLPKGVLAPTTES